MDGVSADIASVCTGTMRSSLRSQAQVEGTLGFLPRLEKDRESASKCLESRFPYNDSSAMPASAHPLKEDGKEREMSPTLSS